MTFVLIRRRAARAARVALVVAGIGAVALFASQTEAPELATGIRAAQAAVPMPSPSPMAATADEPWLADQSARGTRPDAAH